MEREALTTEPRSGLHYNKLNAPVRSYVDNLRAQVYEVFKKYDVTNMTEFIAKTHDVEVPDRQKVIKLMRDMVVAYQKNTMLGNLPEFIRDPLEELQTKLTARAVKLGFIAPVLEMPLLPEDFTENHVMALEEIFGEANLEPLVLPTPDSLNDNYFDMMYPEERLDEDQKYGLNAYRQNIWKENADHDTVGPTKETWKQAFARSLRSESEKLRGTVLFTESRTNSFLSLIHDVFKDGSANRFNRTWDELNTKLLPRIKTIISDAWVLKKLPLLSFDVILTPALAFNIQTTLNHPENSKNTVFEWSDDILLKQDGTDSGRRLIVGHMSVGGAACIDRVNHENRHSLCRFRLSVIIHKST